MFVRALSSLPTSTGERIYRWNKQRRNQQKFDSSVDKKFFQKTTIRYSYIFEIYALNIIA